MGIRKSIEKSFNLTGNLIEKGSGAATSLRSNKAVTNVIFIKDEASTHLERKICNSIKQSYITYSFNILLNDLFQNIDSASSPVSFRTLH